MCVVGSAADESRVCDSVGWLVWLSGWLRGWFFGRRGLENLSKGRGVLWLVWLAVCGLLDVVRWMSNSKRGRRIMIWWIVVGSRADGGWGWYKNIACIFCGVCSWYKRVN